MATVLPDIKRAPARTRKAARGYGAFLLPAAIGFSAIVFVPFGVNVYYSMLHWRGGLTPKVFVGLSNYLELLSDDLFWTSFKNSIAVVIAIVVVPTALGVIIAAVLFDYIGKEFGGRAASFFRATLYLPQILPVAAAGVLWNWVLGAQNGAINTLLTNMGVVSTPNWLGSTTLALPSIMVVLVWGQIGFPVVIFMAALQRVDPDLYEAAQLDGAGWTQRFRHITVPQIRPEVYVVSLTATIYALKLFAPILLLTRGGPEGSTYVPSYYAFYNYFSKSAVGYGAAISNVLTALILAVVGVMMWLQARSERRGEGFR